MLVGATAETLSERTGHSDLAFTMSGDYPSEGAAIRAVAARLGIGSAETLCTWIRQAEVDAGEAAARSPLPQPKEGSDLHK